MGEVTTDSSRSAVLHRTLTTVSVAAGLLAALAGLLPWHRSGEAERSGYAIVASINRLGFAEGLVPSGISVLWFLAPAFSVGALVSLLAGWGRLSALLASFAGLVVTVVGGVVLLAPDTILLGPLVASTTGLVALLAGTASLIRSQIHLRAIAGTS